MNTTEEQPTQETDRETVINFDSKFSDAEVAIIFSFCAFILPLLGIGLIQFLYNVQGCWAKSFYEICQKVVRIS